MKLGLSGHLTRAFIHSPLSPLLLAAALVLGVVALVGLSREEEPQISVPMVDIFVQSSGLNAEDALQRIGKPLEEVVTSVDGVEHVYTQAADDKVMVTARFLTGTDEDIALTRVHEKIRANYTRIPYGVSEPLIVGHGINDVAVITLTLSPKPEAAANWTTGNLTAVAEELNAQLSKVKNVGLTYTVGTAENEVRITPDVAKLNAHGIGLNQLAETVATAARVYRAGQVRAEGALRPVLSGQAPQTVADVAHIVLTGPNGAPVYLADVADVTLAPRLTEQRVWHMARQDEGAKSTFTQVPAVTLAIAKRKGANAVNVTSAVEHQVEVLRGTVIPSSLDVTVTRNYGETANHKANELLFHLALATLSIVGLIVAMVGKRPGLVVLVVIPVTILLTLFAAFIMGYTINRVSLFALIFAIGILVDDAIVVVENIHRHWAMNDDRSATQAAIDAVAEVGNPTIIATLTVVVALLPMMFVSGMMGPYMSPIPAIASLAMVFSFFVAVVLTPWLMIRVDKRENAHTEHKEDIFARVYRRMATPVLQSPRTAKRFLVLCAVATVLCFAFFPLKWVTVKLLPFDNKSELQVVLDMPPGTSLEETERTLLATATVLKTVPEITTMQVYTGTASPFNFNGLVRHSFLRGAPHQGDIAINLLPKEDRSRASHPIAVDIRTKLKALKLPADARLKVVEVPPGPPVLSTLLAEVYGPDAPTRRAVAAQVKEAFHSVDYVVDIDDTIAPPGTQMRFVPQESSLTYYGVNRDALSSTLQTLLDGQTVGVMQRPYGAAPLNLRVQLDKPARTLDAALLSTPIATPKGTVELGELGTFAAEPASWPIFRHNGHTAEMVQAELAGRYEAPIYGMFAVNDKLDAMQWGATPKPTIGWKGQPADATHPTLLWDGEWEITATTFTDMGIAFAVALLGIYLLVVGQFGSFKLPLVILLPVPLSLLGIILGHALLRANFTAPSMIGFIALAGIIVRNSILLVDFIRHARKPGQPLATVLLEAGAIRVKPILLTALAAIIGAAFIITDPIFQGLAVSLLFGLLSSTALTLLAVPAVYVIYFKTGLQDVPPPAPPSIPTPPEKPAKLKKGNHA